jgi:chromosome segregation ATPase
MTPIPMRISFALSAAVALLLPAALPAQLTQPPVEELKRLVKEREREFSHAEVALASARARLARAEGKNELAATEWRKVLAYHQSRLKAVEGLRPCSPEPLQEARGAVTVARVWLADMEDRRDDLRAELPKVIEYYEYRIRKYQTLRRHKAIMDQEAEEALKESGEELKWARDRLAALRDDPAGTEKTGKGDKR